MWDEEDDETTTISLSHTMKLANDVLREDFESINRAKLNTDEGDDESGGHEMIDLYTIHQSKPK